MLTMWLPDLVDSEDSETSMFSFTGFSFSLTITHVDAADINSGDWWVGGGMFPLNPDFENQPGYAFVLMSKIPI